MKTKLISQALEKALTFQKQGTLTQAIELYKTVLEGDSTSFEANLELANCYNLSKDYNNALLYFKKAIKLDTTYYIAHYNMAKIYEKLCKYEFSIFHLEKTIKIAPNFYEALFAMAQCYRKMNDEESMIKYLHLTLEKQPEHPGANHLFASSNNESNSKYASAYAKDLFDRYANHFEEHLVKSLKYEVPLIIKEKLISLNPSKNSKVLDLGCGTGLLGKAIVDILPNLEGVDISSKMIDETRKKDIYSTLYVNDIHDFLLENSKKFDFVIAADVFIYLGSLEAIFSGVQGCLNSSGYFIFTTELLLQDNKADFQLAKNGRCSHSIEYIEALSKKFGFEVIIKEEIILRQENKIGQKGLIFMLKIFP